MNIIEIIIFIIQIVGLSLLIVGVCIEIKGRKNGKTNRKQK